MLEVTEASLNAPAPVITGADIVDIKRPGQIGDDVFKGIVCRFQLNYTEFHINQMVRIKQGLEVRGILPGFM